jgi:pimeloyl-ACP methyl ester carboxylesterase
MLPILFGPRDARLFGVFHGATTTPRSEGIVLCQPIGHEYIRAHRTFRQLAVHLAAAGFPVMRFDYFGCGDSAGAGADGSVPRWIADVHAAIDELRDTAHVSAVTLVGLRLGASIAMLAAATRPDVRRVVLWDPVLNGREYLADLARLQRRWLRGRPGSRLFAFNPKGTELIGFPMPPRLRRDIEGIDLGACRGAAQALHVVSSDRHEEFSRWIARVAPAAPSLAHPFAHKGDWNTPDQVHNGLNTPGIGPRLAGILTEARP